jgi:hypothetical protein
MKSRIRAASLRFSQIVRYLLYCRRAPRSKILQRGGKALGLPDRLDEPAYDGGVRVFEERRRAHRRLVAGGDDKQKGGGEHWRFTDRSAGEKGDVRVLMIGSIPYEDIDNVDWYGDEYYSDPHVYCASLTTKNPTSIRDSTLRQRQPMVCPSIRRLLPTRRYAVSVTG